MNKWYKSGLTKGILIVTAHLLSVVLVISILYVGEYPAAVEDILSGKETSVYADTERFAQSVWYDSQAILNNFARQEQLETDGEFDGQKIVDLKEYMEDSSVSNENKSGLAYRLDDLDKWGKAIEEESAKNSNNWAVPDNPIIVCQKADSNYEYYYYSELKALLESGELVFVMDNSDYTPGELMNILAGDGSYNGEELGLRMIQDQEGRVKYVNCWLYDGFWIEEKYKPVDAENLLEIVNTKEEWNGRLSEAFDMIYSVSINIYYDVSDYISGKELWEEGNTNLSYMCVDKAAEKVYSNRPEFEVYGEAEDNLEKIRGNGKYTIVTPKLSEFDSNMNDNVISASEWLDAVKTCSGSDDNFIFAVNVDTEFPVQDNYYIQNQKFEKYSPMIKKNVVLGGVSALFLLGILLWLTVIAGRNNKDDELHLHPFDRWKTEISAGLIIGVWLVCIYCLSCIWPGAYNYSVTGADTVIYYDGNIISRMVIFGAVGFFTCSAFLIGYLSLVRRIKGRTLWKDSLLRCILNFVRHLFNNFHSLWKAVLVYTVFILIHWFAFSGSGMLTMLMFAVEIAAFVYLVRNVTGRQKIRRGIMKIAGGEVDYKIPLQGLYGEQLEIAERINSIGEGLDAAVEASMKNERLKTDLITNVSHDIKTPLTSIINYIDLLKRENFTDPKIVGYLDVLEAKAQRLKTLTEDVVEASKVSSGNISLEYVNINLVEMIRQTSGEFAEKFQKRNLKEVLNLPEEEAVVRVDGRRMWRVLENIYNNAAKYAMEGTRVYADLKTTPGEVIFSLKNISEQPLNIDADELTERFIRGDISRSTEGSGLGLSIAKSLTQMQGGKFDLYLDGDLFRVTITFPRMVKVEDTP